MHAHCAHTLQSHTHRLQYRVRGALLSIEVEWKQEEWKATLARLRQVHSFDAPNHDDWNDLFNDLVTLEDKLILSDGRKLSMSDLAVRFGLMHTVDSPEPSHGPKMHRELQSMLGLSASSHRFWFLHILMFAFSMSWAVRDDLLNAALSGGDMWFVGSSQCAVSRHWAFKKNCGYAWFALRFCDTTRFWTLPVFTCIVVRSLGMHGYIGADIILLLPGHIEGLVWPLTQTSWGCFGAPLLEKRFVTEVSSVSEWFPSRVQDDHQFEHGNARASSS